MKVKIYGRVYFVTIFIERVSQLNHSEDIKLKDKKQYEAALRMGLCKNVIDINSSQEIDKQRKEYLKIYCPKNFKLLNDEKCFGQFLYCHSALYEFKSS